MRTTHLSSGTESSLSKENNIVQSATLLPIPGISSNASLTASYLRRLMEDRSSLPEFTAIAAAFTYGVLYPSPHERSPAIVARASLSAETMHKIRQNEYRMMVLSFFSFQNQID